MLGGIRGCMSKNLAWFFLIGGICEMFWVSGLKYADTLGLQALTGLGIRLFLYVASDHWLLCV